MPISRIVTSEKASPPKNGHTMKRKVKRRTVRQRRLSRLKRIAERMLASKDKVGLSRLAYWMQDYNFEAEADVLRKMTERLP